MSKISTEINGKLDFRKLPRYQKRQFLPQEADLRDLQQLTDFYSQLCKREIYCARDLERWILDRSELEAAVDQEGSILYIHMTCQTDDAKHAQNYQYFITTIVPSIKPFQDQLNQKFLKEIERYPLDYRRYELYQRSLRADVELFKQENVPLQTRVDVLSQEYQKVCGIMTVVFEGKERTLPEMNTFLLKDDRYLRERAWRETVKRRLQDKNHLEEIFDEMLNLRQQISKNAQFPNYAFYTFKALHRFDYTPEDCRKFHQAVEKYVVPLWTKILEKRRKDMCLEQLRPWDLAVDPLARPPLKPFERIDQLIEGCRKTLTKVDEELGRQFNQMAQKGLLDLANRKGKAPGGYQSTLNEARQPFIFMNAVGLDDDVWTLLHEAGHAFHALACNEESLLMYRHGPMEFNEVASMGMELLAGEYLEAFYNPQDKQRTLEAHLEDVVSTLVWVATIDCFQFWLYESPGHTRGERREAWLRIRKRFGSDLVDWSGLEEEHSYLWHRQLHIFEYPFYYIEYGIAQLGALQLWLNAKNNFGKAISDYRKALGLGGSRPLPELYVNCGIKFDFSEEIIVPLMQLVAKELNV